MHLPAYLIPVTSQENTSRVYCSLLPHHHYRPVSVPIQSAFLLFPTNLQGPHDPSFLHNNPTGLPQTIKSNQTYWYHLLPVQALKIHMHPPVHFASVMQQININTPLPYHSSDMSHSLPMPVIEDLPSKVADHVLVHLQKLSAYNHAVYGTQYDQSAPILYAHYDMILTYYHLQKIMRLP